MNHSDPIDYEMAGSLTKLTWAYFFFFSSFITSEKSHCNWIKATCNTYTAFKGSYYDRISNKTRCPLIPLLLRKKYQINIFSILFSVLGCQGRIPLILMVFSLNVTFCFSLTTYKILSLPLVLSILTVTYLDICSFALI